MLNQITIILPEILLICLAMTMQIVGVYCKNHTRSVALWTILFGIFLTVYIFLIATQTPYIMGFNNSFVSSPIILWFKAFILALTIVSLIIYYNLTKISNSPIRTEFLTLVLLATAGAFISVSASNLILLFCGLELQALASYALTAFNSKNSKSSESGLKYFILGALVSCLMLLGISFLYGFSGSMDFYEIDLVLNFNKNIGLITGVVLLLVGILFKLSAAPMHFWTPDVYEGAPIATVTYFSAAQKIAILIVLINVLDNITGGDINIFINIIKISAILSMIVGALGAIRQNSLKRLMAYSMIMNIGYVLVAITLHSAEGNYAAFIYMTIYVISVLGFFSCLVALFGKKSDIVTFEDLRGIALRRKSLAGAITVLMFSMISLPPFAGFFGKYYVFYNAILSGEITLAAIGILTSVVASYYYLKVIKYMYFMAPKKEINLIPTNLGLLFITTLSVAFVLFFFIFFASEYI